MPKYDYKCENCGVFEKVQPITEEALRTCPTCGGKVTRLISSNVNVIFKGKGFYRTEYKRQELMNKIKKQEEKTPGTDKKSDKAVG
ncbi:MAG TPA: FmdB family transcriptional regulator [Peptococcaceae bacterium]|nr:MAG: hypothetical protein XD50_0482 [Clostridia bacterium 41_269]HBT20380.1 FmdB family transcriptional regulator [Peptococcaceae bacterium]